MTAEFQGETAVSGPYQNLPVPPSVPPSVPPTSSAGGRRRRAVIVVGLLLAVLAAGGWFLTRDDGEATALTPHPDLAELPFPDVEALGAPDGPGFCDGVTAVLTHRQYLLRRYGEENLFCGWESSVASRLSDDFHLLDLELSVHQGEAAADQYASLLRSAELRRERDSPETPGPLYAFPAGEEGWAVHITDESGSRAETSAAFRSGDTTFELTLGGGRQRDGAERTALAEEDGLAELAAIVTVLAGEDAPGEALLTPLAAERHPGLGTYDNPSLTAEVTDRCTALTDALKPTWPVRLEPTGEAGELNAEVRQFGCGYSSEMSSSADRDGEEWLTLAVIVWEAVDRERPDHVTAGILDGLLESDSQNESTRFHALPSGDDGFVAVRLDPDGELQTLQARYRVGPDIVQITISGSVVDGYARAPLPEERAVEALDRTLTAMSG
ncbi:hypothetical protein [Streptomyces profundus]|uniref:hypothetical protein n=1 Tax=Streptomyces profundus TaxID=2867410 RepID=UPI001D166A8D|nr:hypothetical protein [Streptomyces sp. MA3_2.13]UED87915.1 hypothetical protein K4G22_30060 [Streptomyces sp. MA3_2.13]